MHLIDAIIYLQWVACALLGKLMYRLSEPIWATSNTPNKHRRLEKNAQERQKVLDDRARSLGHVVPPRDPNKKLYVPKNGQPLRPHKPTPSQPIREFLVPPKRKLKDETTGKYVSVSEDAPPMPIIHDHARY